MRHHSEQRRVEAHRRERGDTEHHEAHVSHRRERDESLHVGLGQASERAVDDADDRQQTDPGSPLARTLGEDRNRDTHETVGTELQKNGGQDHRTLCGGLRVSIGQPRVEREHRNLDGEAHEHSGEDPDLCRPTEQASVLGEHRNRERRLDTLGQCTAHLEEERDERDEHECRSEHRVEEELERRVLALLAAPHTDHEVHRQQNHFEEDEEEDEVLGDEGSGHTRLEDEHEAEERLGIAGRRNVVPRIDHHEHGDDHRQDVERKAHAIEADGVVAGNDLDPLGVSEELQLVGLVEVELRQRVDTDRQGGESGDQRHRLVRLLVGLGDEEHHHHADQGQEGADGQQPVLVTEYFHAVSPQVFTMTSTRAPMAAAANSSAPY